MTNKTEKRNPEEMRCATCSIRQKAEAAPNSIMARVWKWHTNWCPGWSAYQKALEETRGRIGRAMPNM